MHDGALGDWTINDNFEGCRRHGSSIAILERSVEEDVDDMEQGLYEATSTEGEEDINRDGRTGRTDGLKNMVVDPDDEEGIVENCWTVSLAFPGR